MQYLKADTQVKVAIGPFVDVGDGFTPETGVTLTGGGDNADDAVIAKHDNATVVDVSSNTWAALTNMDGYYHLTLTTSNTDTEGHLVVSIRNNSVHLPVRNDFMVVNANVYDSLFAASGTDVLDVNVAEFSGTTVTAGAIPAAVAGAAGGLFIAGTNAPVTITGSGDALTLTSTGGNGSGINATGNGTGAGAVFTSGSGATGDGVQMTAASTDGNGFVVTGNGAGEGIKVTAGATGIGFEINDGMVINNNAGNALSLTPAAGRGLYCAGTDGNTGASFIGNGGAEGVSITGGITGDGLLLSGGGSGGTGLAVTANAGNNTAATFTGSGTGSGAIFTSGSGATGDGVQMTAASTAGNGLALTGTTTGNGLLTTGGAGAGGDGIEAVAGGGVDIRGDITGDVTGNLSGSVNSVTSEVSADVTKISGSGPAADNLEAGALGIITGTTSGTPTTTVSTTDLTAYEDDELIGRLIVFTTGTAAGQASTITDYAKNVSAGIVTYNTITTAPAASDAFVIV